MNNLYRKTEILANVAIIIVAILIVGVIVRKYLTPVPQEPIAEIPVGNTVPLPDVDWAKNRQTLLLVLKKGCHFCSESAPFYQRLVRETTQHSNVQFVAVLPDPVDEGKQYLNDLGVPLNEVKQGSLAALGVGGTPTLILVDATGKVAASWVGLLRPNKEAEVLNRLKINNLAGS